MVAYTKISNKMLEVQNVLPSTRRTCTQLNEARELCEFELKAEAEKEAAARKHELKMTGLGIDHPRDKGSAFDPARNIRLVPPLPRKGG